MTEKPSVIRIAKNAKRVTLQRVLCSAIARGGQVQEEHLLVLFQNQIWLEEKCQRDQDFSRKYGESLSTLSGILKEVNCSRGLTPGTRRSLETRIREKLQEFLLPPRNWATEFSKVGKLYSVHRYRDGGVPVSKLPPKKVIGKGYGDGGTARDPARDGNPRWQDVGSQASNLARRIQEVRIEVTELRDQYFKRRRGSPYELIRKTKELAQLFERYKRLQRDPCRRNPSLSKAPEG